MLCLRSLPSRLSLQPPVPFDLDDYRSGAERFVEEIDREYYLHLAATSPSSRSRRSTTVTRSCSQREAVEALRELRRAAGGGDEARRLATCLSSPSTGCSGAATRGRGGGARRARGDARDRGRRATDDRRTAQVAGRAGERAGRRAARGARGGAGRGAGGAAQPAARARRSSGRTRAARELGLGRATRTPTPSCAGSTSSALRGRPRRFLEATERALRARCSTRQLERAGCPGLGRAPAVGPAALLPRRRPRRAVPGERLVAGRSRRRSPGSGSTCGRSRTSTSTPSRGRRRRRAPSARRPRVPERGLPGDRADRRARRLRARSSTRAATRSTTRTSTPELPFEFRHLGDNSVTESFAFLFEHLIEDPALARGSVLGIEDAGGRRSSTRARCKLVFMRRYAAKLAYELELHGRRRDAARCPALRGAARRGGRRRGRG